MVKIIEVKIAKGQDKTIRTTKEVNTIGTIDGVTITSINTVQTVQVDKDVVNNVEMIFPSPADACIVECHAKGGITGAVKNHFQD